MLITITVSAMINSTTKEIISDYVNRFTSRVYFTQNIRKVIELAPGADGTISAPGISTEQLLLFADSEYVASALFTGSIHAYGDSFRGLDQGGQEAGSDSDSAFEPSTPYEADENRQIPNCVVLGYSDLSLIEEFKLGLREIDGGRIFETRDECVVSKEFAELNNLSIGNEITLFNVDDTAQTLTLTIAGIYLDATTAQPNSGAKWAINNRRNEILVNYDTLTATGAVATVYTQAEYYLKNPEYGKDFEKELREKGLSEFYNINIDSSNYFQIVEPVKGLSNISNVMMSVVLIFGGSVLVLLSVLAVRERKYEIGVLRAMGMEKGRVATGMLIESLAVIAACLILGLVVGIGIAQPISNNILTDQLKIAQENYTPHEANYGAEVTSQNETDEFDYSTLAGVRVKVTPDMLVLTIAIAFLLGLLSNSVGILYITRFEPIQILTERN
jgi:putative ABC transport system permease protein